MKISEKQYAESADTTAKTSSAKKKPGVGKSSDKSSATSVSRDAELASAKIKLSDKAQDIKKIKDAVNSTPDVDEAKVAKYKAMIAKGDYKVDAQKVADKMVDEHMYTDLFSSKDE